MSQVSRFGALGRAWRARPSPLRNDDGMLLLESFLVAAVDLRPRDPLVPDADRTSRGWARAGSTSRTCCGAARSCSSRSCCCSPTSIGPIQHVAAIIAGLGFGTFIDEIGKFVTADNDYFFRPAVSLIYVVLVIVFLVAHDAGRAACAHPARGAGQRPGPARGPARPAARRR